jgi:hypothetical protein
VVGASSPRTFSEGPTTIALSLAGQTGLDADNLTLSGSIQLDCAVSGKSCIRAGSVTTRLNTIRGTVDSPTFLNHNLSGDSDFGNIDWVVKYSHTSQPEMISRLPLFHAGRIADVNSTLVLRTVRPNSGFARAAQIGSRPIAGILISAPRAGVYELEYRKDGHLVGYVSPSESPLFWIDEGEVVYESVTVHAKGRELTNSQTAGIIVAGSIVVVLFTVAGLSIWRWAIRRMFRTNRMRAVMEAGEPGIYT